MDRSGIAIDTHAKEERSGGNQGVAIGQQASWMMSTDTERTDGDSANVWRRKPESHLPGRDAIHTWAGFPAYPAATVTPTPTPATAAAAAEFIDRAGFVWHQRFELAPGVWTPGSSDVAWLCDQAQVPGDLTGRTVIDVGTTNAGTAFELERRGASRVVAVDIFDPEWFGVRALTEFLGSEVEYVQASVYELADRFAEGFDLVIFWGVLYHLRHPLLALDNLRAITRDRLSLETAVCDSELPRRQRGRALARFYRRDDLAGDSSNWFSPTRTALEEWCGSAGFDVERAGVWPSRDPKRAMLSLRPTEGPAEYEQLSYERPLRCAVR
jgi:tRNA (mo5U34)-methyltransferase